MVAYASVVELKDRLGITDVDRDFALERCLEGASRWVERETARRFYAVSETRYYTAPRYSTWTAPSDVSERPGGGSGCVPIDDIIVPLDDEDEPVYPTLATDEDGDRTFETSWTYGTDWWLEPFNAAVDGKPYRRIERNPSTGRFYFPQLSGAISITGSFGYSSTTPGGIREVTIEMATLLARPIMDLTVAGVQTYKLGAELTVTMDTSDLSENLKLTLLQYKSEPFG